MSWVMAEDMLPPLPVGVSFPATGEMTIIWVKLCFQPVWGMLSDGLGVQDSGPASISFHQVSLILSPDPLENNSLYRQS